MKNANWQNDEPSQKQIDLFNSLKAELGYKGEPKTKGEYRDAITELLQKQATSPPKTYIVTESRSRLPDWMDAYDDDYLGDQGIFPGY